MNVAVDKAKGLIPDQAFPMPPDPKIRPKDWWDKYSKKAKAVPFKDATNIKAYAKVQTLKALLRRLSSTTDHFLSEYTHQSKTGTTQDMESEKEIMIITSLHSLDGMTIWMSGTSMTRKAGSDQTTGSEH